MGKNRYRRTLSFMGHVDAAFAVGWRRSLKRRGRLGTHF
jgi:hypothetical protein